MKSNVLTGENMYLWQSNEYENWARMEAAAGRYTRHDTKAVINGVTQPFSYSTTSMDQKMFTQDTFLGVGNEIRP